MCCIDDTFAMLLKPRHRLPQSGASHGSCVAERSITTLYIKHKEPSCFNRAHLEKVAQSEFVVFNARNRILPRMAIGPFQLPKILQIHAYCREISSVSSEVEQEGPFDLLGLFSSIRYNPKGGEFVAAKLGTLGRAMSG